MRAFLSIVIMSILLLMLISILYWIRWWWRRKKYRELVVAIRTSYYDPIPYPWLFFPGQWFRNQLMSEEQQRMFCCCCYFCFALFFAPNALWWWAWGWRRFLWSISEKKTWFNGCFFHLSLQFCMLSGVLKSISSWQLVKSQRPPQKASSQPVSKWLKI